MYADNPIRWRSDDLLDRATYAARLAEMVFNAPDDCSVVFGISGSWGSGKTSVINMVRERLRELNPDNSESHLLVMNFDPWNYPDKIDLVSPFFECLNSCIQNNSSFEKIKRNASEIAQLLYDYSEVISDPRVKTMRKFVSIHKFRQGKKESGQGLKEIKHAISKKLESASLRIVVIIDDIDRLSDEKVCSVFQLVAAIANFPRVNYLLAYDLDNVVKALNKVQQCDGGQYLEKIVQVPIQLPILSEGAIVRLTQELIGRMFQDGDVTSREYEGLETMMPHVSRSAKTVRDIYRLMNVYEIEWNASQGRIAPDDLLGMVLLRLFYPKIIPWMWLHKAELAGDPRDGCFAAKGHEADEEYQGKIISALGCNDSDAQEIIILLGELFPKFASKCGIRTAAVTDNQLRLKRRIAYLDILNHYLDGTIEAYSFSGNELHTLLENGGVEEIKMFLEQNSDDAGLSFIAAAREEPDSLTSGQRENIARALIRSDLGDVGHTIELFCPSNLGISCMKKMLSTIGEERASDVFDAEALYLNSKGFARLSAFINGQELAHGRLAATGAAKGERIISLECLTHVELYCVSALQNEKHTYRLLTYRGARKLLYLWKSFAPELYRIHIEEELLKEPLAYAIYVSQQLGLFHSSSGEGWAMPDAFSDDVDLRRLTACCGEVPSTKEFWTLDEETKQRVAALSVCIEKFAGGKDSFEDADVLKTEAMERLGVWKSGRGLVG